MIDEAFLVDDVGVVLLRSSKAVQKYQRRAASVSPESRDLDLCCPDSERQCE
jgi:hypothetical protein